MSKKEDLLQFCRYYHGESKPPKRDAFSRFFWTAEMMWMQKMLSEESFADELDHYISADMANFCATDGTPVTLKATMFQYFFKVNEHVTLDDFKVQYKENY